VIGMSLNIVIVEDDENDYELFSRILKKCDFPFEITWLKDGEEVINYLEKTGGFVLKNPCNDVFFLDINLPKVDGLELLKKIKCHPATKECFVVILSGSRMKQDLDIAKENGSDFYLVKPFGKKEINEFSNKIISIFRDLIKKR
jgi:CheY-like chemotaxis protein